MDGENDLGGESKKNTHTQRVLKIDTKLISAVADTIQMCEMQRPLFFFT
jgi:hypothetical protein